MFASPIVPKTRPPSEKRAINVLSKLVAYDLGLALKCGLVRFWLSKYPFPFVQEDESRRTETLIMVQANGADDPDMEDIISNIASVKTGISHLIKYGLCDPAMAGPDHRVDTDTWMVGGESTAGAPPAVLLQGAEEMPTLLSPDGTVTMAHPIQAPRRHRDESAEEAALRRRRREAMVFSDRGQPLGQENIFQRRPTTESRSHTRDTEVEEEMWRIRDEIDREDEENGIAEMLERQREGRGEGAAVWPDLAYDDVPQTHWGWLWSWWNGRY
jgi:hypothetical protein